jgi:PAS domain S-box-containing protein
VNLGVRPPPALARAQDRPLAAVLDEVCRLAEILLPGAHCSVLLYDTATRTLQYGAAPNLPMDFIAAIEPMAVEVGKGASGTAVATGQPVFVPDICTHSYTGRLADLAKAHSLRACWSWPLRAGNQTLGAFSSYYVTPRAPTADEITRTESCANLAALVLEQHRAREAEAETETGFRTAAELVPGHVFIIRPDGQRLYANSYYEVQTGISAELLQGDGWRAVLHPEDVDATLSSYFAALRGGQTWERRFRIRMGDGSYRWFMSRVRPQHHPDGTVAALVGIEVDIDELVTAREALEAYRAELEHQVTERTRALQETAAALNVEMERREAAMAALAQSQKVEALGRLTGGVAHDFNNMLSAIMGGFELIEQRTSDPGVLKLARDGLHACDRAATLVRQLLTVARRDPPAPAWLNVSQTLPRLRDLITHVLQPGIELVIESGPATWPIMADPTQLETALLNLAVNARDAMPAGGRLTVGATNIAAGAPCVVNLPPRDHVLIQMADTGCGIAPDVVPHVFEPFFTTKKRSEGTGLGLAMVHAFVRHADGEIAIDSAPGQGTVVSLYLPRANGPAIPEAVPAPPFRQPGGGARILIVDDDDAVRNLATVFLGDAGYRVLEASGAPQALALLRTQPVDLVMTDLAMPGMDGVQLAALIRSELPALPVLFVTGYAEGHNLSGEMTLQKPFGARMLLDCVTRALGR